jgi:F-type H+-transporting ATPase subunit epsilon
MAALMRVEIVSPEKILFSGDAEGLRCRTTEGDVMFLAGHAPFLGALGTAELAVALPGGAQLRFDVSRGFVEVRENTVIVLTDHAEELTA